MRFNILSLVPFVSTALAAVACNGDARLCSRQYSNVSQIGAHDSPFWGISLSDDQNVPVLSQLNAGIRFLQGQTHNLNGVLQLCHTNCILRNGGTAQDYMAQIKSWLDSNPGQVVTLLLTNGDHLDISRFDTPMNASGLAEYAYVPPKQLAMNEWPTLQQLIDSGKRLVMFIDNGANTAKVPYILDEFSYFFETPFDVTDATFNQCTYDRPSGQSANGRMMLVNHFLDLELLPNVLIPDRLVAWRTNAATGSGSIGFQSNVCFQTYGRSPNLILVDYFDNGNVFAAQNTLNNL